MKAGHGKAKGSAFERLVCKDLSLWVTDGQRDDCLWRSAMSGGRATVASKKGVDLAHVSGDICATHPSGFPLIELFFIECKFYKDLKYPQLVTSNGGLIQEFWHTAIVQSNRAHKHPMLILKQNQYPALVGIDRRMLTCCIEAEAGRLYPLAEFNGIDLVLFDYAAFFKRIPFPGTAPKAVTIPKLKRVILK